MPAGDPAGYLPSVVKKRKRQGQPAYQPRKRGKRFPKIDPGTGGAVAPDFPAVKVPRPQFPVVKNPRRDGYPQAPSKMPPKRRRPGDKSRPISLKPGKGGRRRYFGRGH